MSAAEEIDIPTRILDEANRLFALNGYDGTSLSAIAGCVGIRKPSLLYHFSSKDELRQAVLSRLLDHWNEVLPQILAVATSGDSRFEALVGEVIAFFTADPNRARLLYREMLDRPDELREQMGQFLHPWVKLLAEYIQKGQADGTVRPEVDAEAYILQTIQMIVGTVAVGDAFGGLLDDENAIERQLEEVARVARVGLFVQGETI